jgi:DNA repair exonuclease SbcCD ATPase subunit
MIKVPENASSLFNALSLAIYGELDADKLRKSIADLVKNNPSVAKTNGILEANVEQYVYRIMQSTTQGSIREIKILAEASKKQICIVDLITDKIYKYGDA